jgi:hypothetical protein
MAWSDFFSIASLCTALVGLIGMFCGSEAMLVTCYAAAAAVAGMHLILRVRASGPIWLGIGLGMMFGGIAVGYAAKLFMDGQGMCAPLTFVGFLVAAAGIATLMYGCIFGRRPDEDDTRQR